MKKIRLLLILPFIFTFIFLANRSFAQVPQGITNNPFFDMSKAVVTSFIPLGDKNPKEINIFPFSKIIIQPKSFTDNVNLFVFGGDWDKIKTVLPKNQSPISSYYLVFVDSKGKMAIPTNQITLRSYNNFVGTDTFFYPIGNIGGFDVTNSKRWPGHIMVDTFLPIQDSGFVVSANKILDKNDPSLHLVANPTTTQQKSASQPSASLQKLVALILLAGAALLISYMMWGNKKTSGRKK